MILLPFNILQSFNILGICKENFVCCSDNVGTHTVAPRCIPNLIVLWIQTYSKLIFRMKMPIVDWEQMLNYFMNRIVPIKNDLFERDSSTNSTDSIRDWKPVTNDRPSHLVFGKHSSVKPGQGPIWTLNYFLSCLLIVYVSVANSWQNFFGQPDGRKCDRWGHCSLLI